MGEYIGMINDNSSMPRIKTKSRSFGTAVSAFLLSFFPQILTAQSVTESWLRQATDSCGGGLTVEARGEIEVSIFKRLKITDSGGSGEGMYSQSDVLHILDEFDPDDKERIYDKYMSCLSMLVNGAVVQDNLDPEDVVLDTTKTPPGLNFIEPNKYFALATGDLVGFGSREQLIRLEKVDSDEARLRLSDIEKDRKAFQILSPGESVEFFGCEIVVYEVNESEQTASLFSHCS